MPVCWESELQIISAVQLRDLQQPEEADLTSPHPLGCRQTWIFARLHFNHMLTSRADLVSYKLLVPTAGGAGLGVKVQEH